MILAFYKVINSLGLERNSFDLYEKDEIIKELNKLPDDECRMYDMSVYGYGPVPSPNAADFETDFNDEELDGGGWWCIVI